VPRNFSFPSQQDIDWSISILALAAAVTIGGVIVGKALVTCWLEELVGRRRKRC